MKQKIVIQMQLKCDKCRTKALRIAARERGVISVALEGDSKDKLVVTGDHVDAVCLGRVLKKKFPCVTIISVEEVKKKDDDKKEEKKEEKKECKEVCCYYTPYCPPPPCSYPPYPPYCYTVEDSYGSNCSIM